MNKDMMVTKGTSVQEELHDFFCSIFADVVAYIDIVFLEVSLLSEVNYVLNLVSRSFDFVKEEKELILS